MRTIHRGKDILTKEWRKGNLIILDNGRCFIIPNDAVVTETNNGEISFYEWFEVIPETVEQDESKRNSEISDNEKKNIIKEIEKAQNILRKECKIKRYVSRQEIERHKEDKNYKPRLYTKKEVLNDYYSGGGTGGWHEAEWGFETVVITNSKIEKIIKMLDKIKKILEATND